MTVAAGSCQACEGLQWGASLPVSLHLQVVSMQSHSRCFLQGYIGNTSGFTGIILGVGSGKRADCSACAACSLVDQHLLTHVQS